MEPLFKSEDELLSALVGPESPAELIARRFPDEVAAYDQAGRIARVFLRRTCPAAAIRREYLDAQDSVTAALRSAANDPFNNVRIG